MNTETKFDNNEPVLVDYNDPATLLIRKEEGIEEETDYRQAAREGLTHIVMLLTWLNSQPDAQVAIAAALIAHGLDDQLGSHRMVDIAEQLGISAQLLSQRSHECCNVLGIPPSMMQRNLKPRKKL